MATDPRKVEHLLDCLAPLDVRAKAMFGEYGLYCDARFVGVICEGQLFLKPTKAGLALAPELALEPAYAGAKPSMVIPDARWEEAAWITGLVQVTAQNLPAPKGRK